MGGKYTPKKSVFEPVGYCRPIVNFLENVNEINAVITQSRSDHYNLLQYLPVDLLEKISCIYESVTGKVDNPLLPKEKEALSGRKVVEVSGKQIQWVAVNSAKDINVDGILDKRVGVTPIVPGTWPQVGKSKEKRTSSDPNDKCVSFLWW